MKTVTPYGRSKTVEGSPNRLLAIKNSKKLEEFEGFLLTNEQAVIAAFISVFDKIIKKPLKLTSSSEQAIVSRAKLGAACWEFIEKMFSKHEELKPVWQWKLHPYLSRSNIAQLSNLIDIKYDQTNLHIDDSFRGKWFFSYFDSEFLTKEDFKQAAEKIYKNLFNERRSILPNKGGALKRGAIHYRAQSVANSMPLTKTDILEIPWTTEAEKEYTRRFDAARAIIAKVIELERHVDQHGRSRPLRIMTWDVASILYEGFAKVFYEGNADSASDDGSKQQNPSKKELAESSGITRELYELHEAIRKYYIRIVKTSSKGTKGKSPLSGILPQNTYELCRKIRQINHNKNVNRLIRQGRILHYSAQREQTASHGASENQDYYRTSDGQAEIKRNEAFVRIWRTAISHGARTFIDFIDQESAAKDKYDVLSAHDIDQLHKNFNETAYKLKMQLLFGKAGADFIFPKERQNAEFLKLLLHSFRELRNSALHFNQRTAFVSTLKLALERKPQNVKRLNTDDFLPKIEQFLKTDIQEQKARLLRSLEAIKLVYFATQEQVDQLWDLLQPPSSSDMMMPKFHNLLAHLDGVGQTKKYGYQLPEKPNSVKLQDEATLCRYSALKIVYETRFVIYLTEELKQDELQEAINDVLKRASQRARSVHGNSAHNRMIESKSAKLPLPDSSDLNAYFHELDGLATTVLRVQKGYEQDTEKAKEKSNYVVGFQRELIGRLFLDFLCSNDLEWLLQIEAGWMPIEGAELPEATKVVADDKLVGSWQAMLYALFHLIPVDDLSLLLHQFKKWHVLSKKGGEEAGSAQDEETIRELLSLCIDMHGDKFEGQGSPLFTDAISHFFVDDATIDALFTSSDAQIDSARKGIRQILRFGYADLRAWSSGADKITREEVLLYRRITSCGQGGASAIAQRQKDLADLSEKAVQCPRDFTSADLEDYRTCVDDIYKFRELANKLRLVEPIRLYRLVMQIYGRLLDFANSWERDAYFVTLALLDRKQTSFEEIIGLEEKRIAFAANRDNQIVKSSLKDAELILALFKRQRISPYAMGETHQALLEEVNQYVPILDSSIQKTRNDLAHFNHLHHASIETFNITALVNDVRELMAYDRKQKNAVAKAIMAIMAKEGLELTWKMSDRHQLTKADIRVGEISHLQKMRTRLTHCAEPARTKFDKRTKKQVPCQVRDQLREQPITEEKHSRRFVTEVAKLF